MHGSDSNSLSSQCEATPRESNVSEYVEPNYMPMRKRGKRPLALNNDEGASLFNFASSQENMILLSSDSQQSTSHSQDVVNRLGQLSCQIGQENSNPHSLIESDDSQSIFAEMFSMPSLTPKLSSLHQQGASSRMPAPVADLSEEKKITVAPAITNPFLAPHLVGRGPYKSKRPTTIWLQPFRERPRYISDFEEEGIIGEGQFSAVYRARKRTDGALYAVKKLKTRILSEGEGTLLLREVCALAALRGCPNLIQYFGSWIEDSHVWIQCELCLKVNLDVFVTVPGLYDSRSGSHLQFPYKPRRSTTPHSCLGSEDSGAMWGQEEVESADLASYALTMTRNQSASTDSQSAGSDNGIEGEGQQQWLVFTPEVFWTVLLGVARALAFMHSKGNH